MGKTKIKSIKFPTKKQIASCLRELEKIGKQDLKKTVDSLYNIDSLAVEIARADKYILNFDTITSKYNEEHKLYANLLYTAYATNKKAQRLIAITDMFVL